MNDQIRASLDRLDEELLPFAKEGARFDMFLLGRAALVLSYHFPLSTQDIDIVWMQNSELERKALEVLGKGSALAKALGLYLDPFPRDYRRSPIGFVAVVCCSPATGKC